MAQGGRGRNGGPTVMEAAIMASPEREPRSARKLSVAVWERWAEDCRDPYFMRLWYYRQQPFYTPARRGETDERPTDYQSRAWERALPETGRLAALVARHMDTLDVEDSVTARAVRARWQANTDETLSLYARRQRIHRSTAGRRASAGEEWVEAQIYG